MTMRILRSTIVALIFLATPVATAGQSIDEFFQSFTDQWMRFHTDDAAETRYFTGAEQDAIERQIEPRTLARRQEEARLVRSGQQRLRTFDRSKMSDAQRLSADILAWDLGDRIARESYEDYTFPLRQTYGVHAALTQLMTVNHPVVTAKDAENYVARMAQLAPRMDEAILESQRIVQSGLMPPKFILQAAVRQIQAFLATPAAQNPLVVTFAQRMRQVKNLPDVRQTALLATAEKITAGEVYPAWRKAQAMLEANISNATDDAGLWRFPRGAEAYASRLRQFTTTNMTADQIHETGLRMVAEIDAKIDALLRQTGRGEGSVATRLADFWRAQPTYGGPDAVSERQADIDRIMRDAERRSALLFDRVPKAPVVAQPYPAFMGQRAASYYPPAPDGSRPGTFQYTASDTGPKGRRSTIYHEGVPGHHFQIALQMEDTALPRFRRDLIFGFNSAFAEGWGLYAEHLVAESGWYEGDVAGALDQLGQEVFRAHRLVVDTGIHAKRWTRQQAIDYMDGNIAEVERYIVNPGQACAYMVGELKIIELRERARRELGSRFSLKEFHNMVLGTGMVPLDILEQQANRWIQSKKP